MKLGTKLWAAVGGVIALLFTTLLVATMISSNLSNKQAQVMAAHVIKVSAITNWVGLTETNVVRVTSGLVSSDPAVTEMHRSAVPAAVLEIGEVQKKIEEMNLSPESKRLFDRIGEERKAVLSSLKSSMDKKAGGDQAGAVAEMNSTLLPVVNTYLKSLKEIAALQVKEYEQINAEFQSQRETSANIARSMVIALVLILLAGTWWLIGEIRRPLKEAISVAETIASGDLSVKVEVTRKDEFGEMMSAVAHMQAQLVKVVSDVRQGTDSIANVSSEIEAGNNDLSARTEQTAANLEETASSMQDLTGKVTQATNSARTANQLASSAANVAKRGGEVVDKVVETMTEINDSSRKIADIISVIDSIAFQTNILALNAAVEAARAGEQGRGFAVVASEVRALAGRSSEAAREIKSLITASVEKVEMGTELVANAGQTMTEIVSSIQRVNDIMGEITASAMEQSEGINQVNSAVGHLDQMTQQNAALVEESAAAASSMRDQAHKLATVVATFKLDGALARANTRASTPSPKPFMGIDRRAGTTQPAAKPAAKPVAIKSPTPTKQAVDQTSDDGWETF